MVYLIQDEIRIKENHLKLEKLRLKVKQSKALLDLAATESRFESDKTSVGLNPDYSLHLQLFSRLFFLNVQIDKILPMLGFEPRISGVGSDRSTN